MGMARLALAPFPPIAGPVAALEQAALERAFQSAVASRRGSSRMRRHSAASVFALLQRQPLNFTCARTRQRVHDAVAVRYSAILLQEPGYRFRFGCQFREGDLRVVKDQTGFVGPSPRRSGEVVEHTARQLAQRTRKPLRTPGVVAQFHSFAPFHLPRPAI